MKFKFLIGAGAIAAAMSAQAANTVKLTQFAYEPRATVPGPYNVDVNNYITSITVSGPLPDPPPAGSYRGAGQMSGLLNGNSFAAYCVEISIPVSFGTTYTDYNQLVGAAGFGTRAANLASLLTWADTAGFSVAGVPVDAARSAALQAAVWEVVHETTDSFYSFGSGRLATTSPNLLTQSALTTIQNNWSTIMTTAPIYTVSRLDGANQDLLIFAPVPEAGTLGMMVLGLAGVGFAARKRRQS